MATTDRPIYRNAPEFRWHASSYVNGMHPKPAESPKLLDQVRQACRLRHYSPRTEDAYRLWIRRFILFHNKQHPRTLGPADVTTFLSSLATRDEVSASTQNQALCALLFLYRSVLGQPLPETLDGLVRARTPATVPTVLTRSEVRAVLAKLTGAPALVASLLYGSGLRLLECLELRVKDIDFETRQLTIRQGMGRKDRVTMLPLSVVPTLAAHLEDVRRLHQADSQGGRGRVVLPHGLATKYPNADRSWAWQFVFRD